MEKAAPLITSSTAFRKVKPNLLTMLYFTNTQILLFSLSWVL